MLDKTQVRILHKNKLKHINYLQAHKSVRLAFSLIKKMKVKNILLYSPLKYEPAILSYRRKFSFYNHKLFLPFMLNKSLKIVKLRLPFTKGKFNIMEAADSNAFLPKIDVALVPIIAVDMNMARVGHGNGFYDRFFASLGYRPRIIFISSSDCFVKAKICDPYDVIGDFYITPQKIRTKYDRSNHRSNLRCSWCRSRVFSCQKNQ